VTGGEYVELRGRIKEEMRGSAGGLRGNARGEDGGGGAVGVEIDDGEDGFAELVDGEEEGGGDVEGEVEGGEDEGEKTVDGGGAAGGADAGEDGFLLMPTGPCARGAPSRRKKGKENLEKQVDRVRPT
jgi:hypothetical protein